MNLVIQDDEGQIIYGHAVLKRISQTGMTPEVNIVRGIVNRHCEGSLLVSRAADRLLGRFAEYIDFR
jgi:hypothetical protein